jgi:hypothetical protein
MSSGGDDQRHGGAAERYLPAFVIAFLFFVPQLSALAVERNRYFRFWSGRDTLAACAAIAALGALGLLFGALVDRSGSPFLRSTRDQAMSVLFGLGLGVNLLPLLHVPWILNLLKQHRATAVYLSKVGLVGLAASWLLLLLFRRDHIPRLMRGACLVLSPLIPILLLPAFFWSGFEVPSDRIPASPAPAREGTPVYLFVFDEWSFERSAAGDDFDSDLDSLRRLRDQSFFFTQARSPSRTTYLSLPEILFQSHDFPGLPRVLLDRTDFPDKMPADAAPYRITPAAAPDRMPSNLFRLARSRGYETVMLGYYLPYRLILGGEVDLVRTYSDYPSGGTFAQRMRNVVIENPHYWRVPLLSRLWKEAYAPLFSRRWAALNDDLWRDFDAVVAASPERSLVIVHLPSPHAPFVFAPDGGYLGPFPVRSRLDEDIDVDIMGGTRADYHRNVLHLDTVVGRIVDRLRRAGRFDKSLVIMTSDHSWRTDPDMPRSLEPERVRHVPLLIKVPGQSERRTIDAPFDGRSFGPIIEAALDGRLDTRAAERLIPAAGEAGTFTAAGGAAAAGDPPARPGPEPVARSTGHGNAGGR